MRIAFVLLFVLLVPAVASASWMAPGGREPDTPQDVNAGMMWTSPNVGATRQVYLQGFQTLPATTQSPNVGATGSRLVVGPAADHRVMLGVWMDCNRDGYVGFGELGLQEYRSELLPEGHACPVDTSNGPVHHDGLWVSEFLGLGTVDPCEFESKQVRERDCPTLDAFSLNERVIYENGTMVWADTGAPGHAPRVECLLVPWPKDTFRSTGATLEWLDCQAGHQVATTINVVDADGSLGVRFTDPERPQDSGSLLNVPYPVTLWGGGDAPGLLGERDAPAATMWDCSRPRETEVRDPTGAGPRSIIVSDPTGGAAGADRFPFVIVSSTTGIGFYDHDGDPSTSPTFVVPLTDSQGAYAHAAAPAPGVGDPRGSWWASGAHAVDGVAGDCEPSTPGPLHGNHPARLVEADHANLLSARKDRASIVFMFYDGHRGIHPRIDGTTGEGAPSDGGLMVMRHGRGGDGPVWFATTRTQDPQIVDRGSLQPSEARWFTYYARLGDSVERLGLHVPGSWPHTYGAEACGGHTSGIHGGWVCDPSAWWRSSSGADLTPRYAQGQRYGPIPGDLYHMRDVDCLDGALVDGLVFASLTPISPSGVCARP